MKMKLHNLILSLLIISKMSEAFIITPNYNMNILRKNRIKLYCNNDTKIDNIKINIYNKLIYNNDKIPKLIRYFIHNNFSLKESELKHGRIAMLAVVGRIIAETIHPVLALKYYKENLLVNGKLVPSILNGGLTEISGLFYLVTFVYVFIIELNHLIEKTDLVKKKEEKEKEMDNLEKIEINFGRIAMLLTTWFTYYEYVTKNSIINYELIALYPYFVFGVYILIFT